MTSYRISTIARLLGVSSDTVRRWLDDGLIKTQEAPRTDSVISAPGPGPKRINGKSVVEFICQKPDFHQLHSGLAQQHSIRNHFEGLVTAITSDKVMSQVEMQCGPFRVVSLISTEAVKELGLEIGSIATAQVKATNVAIGLPPGEKL